MILALHSNASYLSKPKARSQAGGHFFLSSNTPIPPNNGAGLNIAHIIKHVMSSATEAELAGLYIWLERQDTSESSLKKWDTNSPPHCHKPTTQWLKLWSMVKYNQNKQKPWMCNSIGYGIKNVNSSSEYTGGKDNWIMRTIGQNTMQLYIIKTCAKNS